MSCAWILKPVCAARSKTFSGFAALNREAFSSQRGILLTANADGGRLELQLEPKYIWIGVAVAVVVAVFVVVLLLLLLWW